jgi:gliding motility-associated-like protein
MRKLYLLFSFLLLLFAKANAQLIVTNTQTPQQLVQNILLGNGVTATNITFTGNGAQIGFFKSINTNLGIDSGVVITSGDVTTIPGDQTMLSTTSYNSVVGDPDLATLLANSPFVSNGINDVAILEFDFIPQGDTVKFDYVFASEEYPDFVCDFNDMFGLFLSGPGLAGPYTNSAINIALVPGTTQSVSIATVNNGDSNNNCAWAPQNQQFYVNNAGSLVNKFNAFTTVFTAKSAVTCGLTYHVKMAVSDVLDWSYDSGVFLKANSFSSQGIILSSAIDMGGNDSTLYEGCGNAKITMLRGGNINIGDTLYYIIGGSPNNNDYVPFADSVVFFPGQDSAFIYITALQDNLVEGIDTVTITTISGPCASMVSTISIYISDTPEVVATAGNDTIIRCPGDPATLYAYGSNGLPGYTYEWDQGVGWGRVRTVNPLVTTTYVVTVRDTCGQFVDTDTMVVGLPYYQPLQALGCPDRYILCPGQQVQVFANASGGLPPYTFTWTSPAVNGSSINVNPYQDTLYYVNVTDFCGQQFSSDTIHVYLIPFDSMVVELPQQLTICPGDSVVLAAQLFGGVEGYNFFWPHSGETTQSVTVYPQNNNLYTVELSDQCGHFSTSTCEVLVNKAIANFEYQPEPEGFYKILFTDKSLDPVSFEWSLGDGSDKRVIPSFSHEFPDSGFYEVTLITKNSLGCYDTTTKNVWVDPELFVYLPNAFTPNADGINDRLMPGIEGLENFSFTVYDRWGKLVWQNNSDFAKVGWDGKTLSGKELPQGSYIYQFSGTGKNNKAFKQKGTLSLIR